MKTTKGRKADDLMDIRMTDHLQGKNRSLWQTLMARTNLAPDEDSERTVLVFEHGELVAAGSRKGNLLKCIAVDPMHQGEDLTATLLTALREDAFRAGFRHLFLYTKPANEFLFRGLFFYPVVKTGDVLLMENVRGGIQSFLQTLPVVATQGKIGAAVMNCDPFTLGHQHLIQTAAKQCDHLYIFVLSEDQGHFSSADRLAMVKAGTAHLENVTVLPTGPYLISSATFPTYFLKNRDQAETVHCALDIAVFTRYFVPRFSIGHRFVGEEPLSAMTSSYNDALVQLLPKSGVQVHVIPRLCREGAPISASEVRARLAAGAEIRELVPETTYAYLRSRCLV